MLLFLDEIWCICTDGMDVFDIYALLPNKTRSMNMGDYYENDSKFVLSCCYSCP